MVTLCPPDVSRTKGSILYSGYPRFLTGEGTQFVFREVALSRVLDNSLASCYLDGGLYALTRCSRRSIMSSWMEKSVFLTPDAHEFCSGGSQT